MLAFLLVATAQGAVPPLRERLEMRAPNTRRPQPWINQSSVARGSAPGNIKVYGADSSFDVYLPARFEPHRQSSAWAHGGPGNGATRGWIGVVDAKVARW